ncbi:MAG: hypothetical protein KGK18_09845 [Burkholderiales bacterium]|nr:hypothetical protein [Burkholderiales bacterium]
MKHVQAVLQRVAPGGATISIDPTAVGAVEHAQVRGRVHRVSRRCPVESAA